MLVQHLKIKQCNLPFWGLKIKNFRVPKHTTMKVKRQSKEWVKNYINYLSKGRVSRIYKFNNKKDIPTKEWERNLNRHFFKEDLQMVSKHMKRQH